MRTKDWKPALTARVLLISEDPNLQWSDSLPDYPHFADYYFRKIPRDHGERSRYVEACDLFDMIEYLSNNEYSPNEVLITHLCNDSLERAPKGKKTLIPPFMAIKGVEHIRWILEQNPTIECIFSCSMQTNYWLQEAGLIPAHKEYLKGAEPRRTGKQNDPPYYQPVNAKVFAEICGKETFLIDKPDVRVFPLLPVRDFPLRERNAEQYAEVYRQIRHTFNKEKAE